jgi:protocatechuate 3,4-dioxygenase beta subunit
MTEQNEEKRPGLSRRTFLYASATVLLAACGAPGARTQQPSAGGQPAPVTPPTSGTAGQALPPTPACGDDDDEVTPSQTEGPYYTPKAPERTSLLEPGMKGTKLVLTGHVLSTDCKPVARALVDFWQADDAGEYDNKGFRLRGHQFTDDTGRYTLETIMPGLYPGRTRHIHVKVQAPNQEILTTKLYFPGEKQNETDGIFHEALVINLTDTADGKAGRFNFVLS